MASNTAPQMNIIVL